MGANGSKPLSTTPTTFECSGCKEKIEYSLLSYRQCFQQIYYCLPCYQRYNITQAHDGAPILCLVDYFTNKTKRVPVRSLDLPKHFAWKHLGVEWYFDKYLNAHANFEVYAKTFSQKYMRYINREDHSDGGQEEQDYSKFVNFRNLVNSYVNFFSKYRCVNCVSRCSKCDGFCYSTRLGLSCANCQDEKCVKCYESLHPGEDCDFETLRSMIALRKLYVRPCPSCYTAIHVFQGCDTVSCPRCNKRVTLSNLQKTAERLESDQNYLHKFTFPPSVFGGKPIPSAPFHPLYDMITRSFPMEYLFRWNRLCYFICVERTRFQRLAKKKSANECIKQIKKYLKVYIAIYATIVCMSEMLNSAFFYVNSSPLKFWWELFGIERNFNVELDQIHRDTGVKIDVHNFFGVLYLVFEKNYGLTRDQMIILNNSRLINYI
jgi:hypothetical protein